MPDDDEMLERIHAVMALTGPLVRILAEDIIEAEHADDWQTFLNDHPELDGLAASPRFGGGLLVGR